MKPYQPYLDELEGIKKRADDEVTALAKKVREKIILPACRKHRLSFWSGNGSFGFRKNGRMLYDDPRDTDFLQLPKAAQATLRPIFDLLNEEISHAQVLGTWVEDVEDVTRKR